MRLLIATFCLLAFTMSFSQATERYSFSQDSILKNGMIFKCPIIETEIGGKRLLKNSTDSVKLISAFLLRHSDWVFELSNHTDHRGNAESNQKLSESYASFIKDVLVRDYSIPKEQLLIKGYGGTELLVSSKKIKQAKTKEEKESLHSINRRYELKAIKKKVSK